jgi:Glucose inhibited division protein A
VYQREAGTQRAPRECPAAVVVGAGVSGCACAAVLASAGVHVTLLNSAMDRVGLPGYGPEIVAGPNGWLEIGETMALLPWALRQAWLTSAAVPASGIPVLIVDRRAVSIETKRALERIPRLEFRQGLVTDLRIKRGRRHDQDPRSDREHGGSEAAHVGLTERAMVETVFGEVFEADAVILSVGLGLGGRISVGADLLRAGRYGETPADGLKRALEVLGASLTEVSLHAGAHFPSSATGLVDSLVGSGSDRRVEKVVAIGALLGGSGDDRANAREAGLEEPRRVVAKALSPESGEGDEGLIGRWPEFYPPAAHWIEELPHSRIVVAVGDGGSPVALLTPDGRTTAEVHVSPEGRGALDHASAGTHESVGPFRGPCEGSLEGCEGRLEGRERLCKGGYGAPASRLEYTVRASVVEGLGPDGRLLLEGAPRPPIWVTGRAAGEADYLGSLRSGAQVGSAVARELLTSDAEQRDDDIRGWDCRAESAPSAAGSQKEVRGVTG